MSSIWAMGCVLDDCVCVLSGDDCPSLVEGGSRGLLL